MAHSISMTDQAVRPSRIHVPENDLDDLRNRLERTRWGDELVGAGSDYGVPVAYVRRLANYWLDGYDWRKWEARINQHGPSETLIDDQRIHFLHVRSAEPEAFPLILTHGWPGSIVEFLDVIEPLTNPRAHGGDPSDAFHLVIPSLPGFGFSGPTRARGWDNPRIARAWAELMARRGYERYGAVGNDAGSMISPELGRHDPEHVTGVHVTQLFSFPSGDPGELSDLSPDEQAQLGVLQWFYQNKFSFNVLMAQQPQTLGYALDDSPVGLLAWLAQLLGEELDADFVLTNVMTYWLTRTGSSAARLYYENAHGQRTSDPTTLPTGVAGFGGDFYGIRRFAERDQEHRSLEDVRSRGPLRRAQGTRHLRRRRSSILSRDRTVNVRASIRIVSPGHMAFAAAMIGLGVMGLVTGAFTQIWQPVPKWVPERTALAYLCALISLGSGIGLLWRRSARLASRAIFVALLLWLLVMRAPNLFYERPLVLVAWTFGATAVMLAGAWVLSSWFAREGDRPAAPFFADDTSLRVARTLYGLSLIPFGLAHFMYLDATTVLIPAWLPGHVAWAYFTGGAFIAAGLAICVDVLAPLAAALSALQMALFSVIVWIPRAIAGNLNAFQRGEVISTFVLTAGAWVVADSYRRRPAGTPTLPGSPS